MHALPPPELRGLWLPPILRGVAGLAFGGFTIGWPGPTALVLVIGFGVYVLVDGVAALVGAVRSTTEAIGGRTLTGTMGLAGIGAGIVALCWPGITAIALAWLIGLWALCTGLLEISVSFNVRPESTGLSWLTFLSGLLSVGLGVLIAFRPERGALDLVWMIGLLSMLWGVVLIGLGLLVRHEVKRLDSPLRSAAPPVAPA